MRLIDYSLSGFRAFSEKVELSDLGRVNLIAGQNNVGKSALLLPLRRLTRLDASFVERIGSPDGVSKWGGIWFLRLLDSDFRDDDKPLIGLHIELDEEERRRTPSALGHESPRRWCFLNQAKPGGLMAGSWDAPSQDGNQGAPEIKTRLEEFARNIVYVPPHRAAGTTIGLRPNDAVGERLFDGQSLLTDLLHSRLSNDDRNSKLEAFLSSCLETPAELSLSVQPPGVRLKLGGDPPMWLENLGSGVQQLVVLAAAATSSASPVLLIEEPELGLHPRLQRRFIEVLSQQTNVTAFVTTHSPHVLDFVNEHVRHFHLRRRADGQRDVRAVSGSTLELIRELGARPSSLLQANCVIWVEGPSDAIYIRHWLERLGRANLLEGLHFSFAFYGGALLKHYAAATTLGRVDVGRIHPSWFLVADSDRRDPQGPLGHAYLRDFIRALESDERNNLWITDGKEIESYVSDEDLGRALGKGQRPAPSPEALFGRFYDRVESVGGRKWPKVAVADAVVALGDAAMSEELKRHIARLVSFIESAQIGVVASGV